MSKSTHPMYWVIPFVPVLMNSVINIYTISQMIIWYSLKSGKNRSKNVKHLRTWSETCLFFYLDVLVRHDDDNDIQRLEGYTMSSCLGWPHLSDQGSLCHNTRSNISTLPNAVNFFPIFFFFIVIKTRCGELLPFICSPSYLLSWAVSNNFCHRNQIIQVLKYIEVSVEICNMLCNVMNKKAPPLDAYL